MKHPFPLYILSILLLLPALTPGNAQHTSARQGNPLLGVVGKPYHEYYETYSSLLDSLFYDDSISRAALLGLFDEAAAADKSGVWEAESHLMKLHVRFCDSRDGGFVPSSRYTSEEFVDDLQKLLASTGKGELRFVRIRLMFDIAEAYRIYLHDYERAFAWYLEMAAGLDKVTTRQCPPRPYYYRRLGDLYYMFREYADAMIYYQKVINDPDTWDKANRYREQYSAMNNIGLCYRDGKGDYHRADSCFRQVLRWAIAEGGRQQQVWEGIAEGNIGHNYYLQGDFDAALGWLLPSVEKITNTSDFPFASSRAVNTAAIYLKRNDPASAKKYIDIALDRHCKSGIPEKGSSLYDVMLRYYTLTGDRQKATAYLDSTLMAKELENKAFGGLALRRVEQQLRASDNRLHKHQLDVEQARSRFYRRTAIITATALALIIALLGLTLFFYRRKRNAYRELVRQSQHWAGIAVPGEEAADPAIEENTDTPKTAAPEENDRVIMESVDKAMSEKRLYKRPELSLDLLATATGFNRYYLSQAMNRYAGKNFSSYVNEYRIKEAIRIMSDPENEGLTFDAVAAEAGFNDRQNFHRVFKKKTGLSPGDFRRNLNGG